MAVTRTIKIALCLPWYNGADPDCVAAFLTFQHYLGRIQERSWWIAELQSRHPEIAMGFPDARPLDSWDKTNAAEIPAEFFGVKFEFLIVAMIGYSLPGIAREHCIDAALASGADYLLFYDDDMMFDCSILFKLLRHEKPFVAALAFTARPPITPVIYKFTEGPQGGVINNPVLNYERDALQKVDAVGFGVVLIQGSVFRRMPKPWFANPGAGEDIQFCFNCRKFGIPIYVDTSAKTVHKPRYAPEWHDEGMYLRDRADDIARVKTLAFKRGPDGPVPLENKKETE